MNNSITLKYLGYSDQFELAEDIYYILSNSKPIKIKKGFVTDLASTPRIVWSIFPPFGKYAFACVIHDYLYINSEIIVSRAFADAEFKRIIKASGASVLTANLFYAYVRALGWINWNKFKKRCQ